MQNLPKKADFFLKTVINSISRGKTEIYREIFFAVNGGIIEWCSHTAGLQFAD